MTHSLEISAGCENVSKEYKTMIIHRVKSD